MEKIRAMSSEDLDRVVDIETRQDGTHWTRKQFESELKNHQFSFPIVLTNDIIVGYAIGRSLGIEYELLLIVVDDKYRKKGFGRKLIQKQCGIARETGAELMFLEVRQSNLAAQALYVSTGFTVIGERKRYYNDGETAVLMQYRL